MRMFICLLLVSFTCLHSQVPAWEFHTLPIPLMFSYYDYMPGGYNECPIKILPGELGGGVFLTYHAQIENEERDIYYSVINDDGSFTSQCLNNENRTGYPSLALCPGSGLPVIVWHERLDEDDSADLALAYKSTLNGDFTKIPIYFNLSSEEFIWPHIFIGDSPVDGMQRIYVYATTQESNTDYLCPLLFMYTDYLFLDDLSDYTVEDWTTTNILQFDEWRENDIVPYFSFSAGSGGKLAFAGNTKDLTENPPDSENEFLFVLENENYGEGDWILYTGDDVIEIIPPVEEFPYQNIEYLPNFSKHHNLLYDFSGNIWFLEMFSMFSEDQLWFTDFSTVKMTRFNRETFGFEVRDVYPQSDDGSLYLPWDNPPQFDQEGNLITHKSWPVYWVENNDVYSEQYYKIGQNKNWMVSVFSESMKAKMYHDGNVDYADWAEAPEIFIQISNDFGETWFDPIKINSVETPEFADIIPEYIYVCEDIEQIDETQGRIHLMFLDDDEYGSVSYPYGGYIDYMSLDIDFQEPLVASEDNFTEVPQTLYLSSFPNPFTFSGDNRSSGMTIDFNLPEDTQTNISVYNLKGQLVKRIDSGFYHKGSHSLSWSGRNEQDEAVTSGIYLLKVSTDHGLSNVRKVMIIK